MYKSLAVARYCRTDTKVVFGGIVFGLRRSRSHENVALAQSALLYRCLIPVFAGGPPFGLEQIQLAGARHGFRSPSYQ